MSLIHLKLPGNVDHIFCLQAHFKLRQLLFLLNCGAVSAIFNSLPPHWPPYLIYPLLILKYDWECTRDFVSVHGVLQKCTGTSSLQMGAGNSLPLPWFSAPLKRLISSREIRNPDRKKTAAGLVNFPEMQRSCGIIRAGCKSTSNFWNNLIGADKSIHFQLF